jgi:hypothetical protein
MKHEIDMNEENCFITLTYEDDYLPKEGLVKEHFQQFMKRLRWKYDGKRFKFYAVGEYGTDFGRPHYHSLLFGLDFSDKVHWALRNGNKSFRSDILESLWPWGHCEIGEACFESAAYVSRYLVKDYSEGIGQKGVREWREAVGMTPEFCLMSRGGRVKGSHGIGYGWYESFHEELLKFDSIRVRDREMSPPRYYDKLLANDYPEFAEKIKRLRRGRPGEPDKSERQLYADALIAKKRLTLKSGGNL